MEMTFAIVLDASLRALGAMASVRDITERFAREREQRKRLAEMENEVRALGQTAQPLSRAPNPGPGARDS